MCTNDLTFSVLIALLKLYVVRNKRKRLSVTPVEVSEPLMPVVEHGCSSFASFRPDR